MARLRNARCIDRIDDVCARPPVLPRPARRTGAKIANGEAVGVIHFAI
jgi:hypothetical protein